MSAVKKDCFTVLSLSLSSVWGNRKRGECPCVRAPKTGKNQRTTECMKHGKTLIFATGKYFPGIEQVYRRRRPGGNIALPSEINGIASADKNMLSTPNTAPPFSSPKKAGEGVWPRVNPWGRQPGLKCPTDGG
jgi:hypothetical protein